MKVRFAPSPTGRLHVGNIRTALMNWLFAKRIGASFLLRIDDTDFARSTKAFEDGIRTDLAWLGLAWDEEDKQSARSARYEAAAETLKASGLLYACYETAEELDRKRKIALSRGRPPIYDRAALKLSDAEKAAFEAEGRVPHWRFKLSGARVAWTDLVRGEQTIDTASISDPVLIRADGAFLYTLPSVVDDIELGVTHVIRGEDHVANTGVQIEIFRALSDRLPTFGHFPLLVGADGEALSKRLGSMSIEDLRAKGVEPMAILSLLAKLGTSDAVEAVATLGALAETFDFAKVGRAPARFDPDDVGRLNAQLLHGAAYVDVQGRLAALGADRGEAAWNAVRANLSVLADAADWARVIDGPVSPVIEDAAFCATAASLLPVELGPDAWGAWTGAVKAATGAKGRALFLPLRQALTGMDHGPEMGPLLALIGREKALKRLAGEAA
jgi:glutamyl-tRNA synthetase